MIPIVHQQQREARNQALSDFTALKERESAARKQPTSCGPNRGPYVKICGACGKSKPLDAYDNHPTGPCKLNLCRDCAEQQASRMRKPQPVMTMEITQQFV
jgi:hypothetical protein